MGHRRFAYVALREQPDGSYRPRFVPGPRERALGYAGMDLRHGVCDPSGSVRDGSQKDGAWFSLDEVDAFSRAKQTEISAARRAGVRPKPIARRGESVRDLLEDWLASRKFLLPRADGGYAEETKKDYRAKVNAILWRPQTDAERRMRVPRELEPIATVSVHAIEPTEISNDEDGGFYDYLRRTRGLTMARQCVMTMSAAWKWGRKATRWRLKSNPCEKLNIAKARASAIPWEFEEFIAFVRFADHPAVNEPELADAVVLALFSAQRQADVLAYDGAGSAEGRTRLIQSKRGTRVSVPQLPPLVDRLKAMAERRIARGYACPELIVDGRTAKGFNPMTFRHRMINLRRRAAAGDAALSLAPCPSLDTREFRGLRKTMLTWIKRAGARDNQFASVSGHSLASLPAVMPHYYAPGAEEAAEAMALVWDWMQKKGMVA